MSLSKEQYDKVMAGYAQKRNAHRKELSLRKREIYTRIPEYQKLDQDIPDLAEEELSQHLGKITNKKESADSMSSNEAQGNTMPKDTRESFSARLNEIAQKKSSLLVEHGYPEDYLSMQYDCPDCHDTGYIGNKKCHCLRQQELQILYRQSRLGELTKTNNFNLLSESYYHGDDLIRFQQANDSCHSFIQNFDSRYENLFFYGTVGTGKSFLSISTAGELLKTGHSVLYFSSSSLFDAISSCLFQTNTREEYQDLLADLQQCDLLVLDDLGTEITNHFVSTQLFSLINERDIGRKSSIISTNLSLYELRDRYSDRIFSRITSSYTVRKLTGPDIRIEKKIHNA